MCHSSVFNCQKDSLKTRLCSGSSCLSWSFTHNFSEHTIENLHKKIKDCAYSSRWRSTAGGQQEVLNVLMLWFRQLCGLHATVYRRITHSFTLPGPRTWTDFKIYSPEPVSSIWQPYVRVAEGSLGCKSSLIDPTGASFLFQSWWRHSVSTCDVSTPALLHEAVSLCLSLFWQHSSLLSLSVCISDLIFSSWLLCSLPVGLWNVSV